MVKASILSIQLRNGLFVHVSCKLWLFLWQLMEQGFVRGGGVGRGNDENKILWSGGGDGSRGNF